MWMILMLRYVRSYLLPPLRFLAAAKEEDQKVRVCAEHLRHYNVGLQLSSIIRMCDALEVLSDYQEAQRKKKETPKEEEAEPIQTTPTETFLFNLFDGWLLVLLLLGVCKRL